MAYKPFGNDLRSSWAFTSDVWLIAANSGGHGHKAGNTGAGWGDGPAIREKFAPIFEQDDTVAQQAPALPGLIRHDLCCKVIRRRPFRTPRLVLAHVSLRYRVSLLLLVGERPIRGFHELMFSSPPANWLLVTGWPMKAPRQMSEQTNLRPELVLPGQRLRIAGARE